MIDSGAEGSDPVGEILKEIRAVQLRLAELPRDAISERVDLRERQRELRVRAIQLGRASRSEDELRRRLRDLRRIKDEILNHHMSVGHVGGGAGPGGGMEPRFVAEFNRTVDDGWDRAGIEAATRALETELRDS